MDELTIRRAVRDAYGARAGSCCGPSDLFCGTPAPNQKLGVGDPVSLADLAAGEVVLDLGSGRGDDVLAAAERVGPNGRAIGVDATPEMVFAARDLARSRGLGNAEFRLGEIEHLPVESESVDVIVSDCVVNLSPDKAQVIREAYRVLRPGGRIVLSDVVTDGELPEAVRKDPRAWAGCVAGAVSEAAYRSLLVDAGFREIETLGGRAWVQGLRSTVLVARKPSRPA